MAWLTQQMWGKFPIRGSFNIIILKKLSNNIDYFGPDSHHNTGRRFIDTSDPSPNQWVRQFKHPLCVWLVMTYELE